MLLNTFLPATTVGEPLRRLSTANNYRGIVRVDPDYSRDAPLTSISSNTLNFVIAHDCWNQQITRIALTELIVLVQPGMSPVNTTEDLIGVLEQHNEGTPAFSINASTNIPVQHRVELHCTCISARFGVDQADPVFCTLPVTKNYPPELLQKASS